MLGPIWLLLTSQISLAGNWRTADRHSAHIAPDPAVVPEAVVQVYSARAFDWRGLFALHTWIAVKLPHAHAYQVLQVIGWRAFWGKSVVSIETDVPDRLWFGKVPTLLLDLRGKAAEKVIPLVQQAAQHYPYQRLYRVWPGPNSNSFIAYIVRNVPELAVNIPANAVGMDYLENGRWHDVAPSHTGHQLSLLGVFGITVAKVEGLQFNILGLKYGIQFSPPALVLPGIGAI